MDISDDPCENSRNNIAKLQCFYFHIYLHLFHNKMSTNFSIVLCRMYKSDANPLIRRPAMMVNIL